MTPTGNGSKARYVTGLLGRPVYVMQMGGDQMGDDALLRWLTTLRAACVATIGRIDEVAGATSDRRHR